MIMMGLHLMKDRRPEMADRVPFRALYLHALVRDPEGLKMSKTRGNVVDPLELIEKYGTDALRFTLTVMAAPGTDIALSEDRILSYRAFANKIWNAARFIFVNLEKFQAATGMTIEELAAPEIRAAAPYACGGQVSLADRWIFSRSRKPSPRSTTRCENFRFHEAAHVVYHFFWGDFCDWYIEWVKPALADAESRGRCRRRGATSSPFSMPRCGCCIPSCRFSPRSSGTGCRSARGRGRSRSRHFLIRQRLGAIRKPSSRWRYCRNSSSRRATFAPR